MQGGTIHAGQSLREIFQGIWRGGGGNRGVGVRVWFGFEWVWEMSEGGSDLHVVTDQVVRDSNVLSLFHK